MQLSMIQREGLTHETRLATTLQQFRDDEQHVRRGATGEWRSGLPFPRTLDASDTELSSLLL